MLLLEGLAEGLALILEGITLLLEGLASLFEGFGLLLEGMDLGCTSALALWSIYCSPVVLFFLVSPHFVELCINFFKKWG